jgi:BirA family biotin operon repressor/biotin-[acetyl-CoA-carboxylase] ligase
MAGGLQPAPPSDPAAARLLRTFLGDGALLRAPAQPSPWTLVLLAEHAPRSNYDALIELARAGADLPHGMACLAGSGRGFHGFKGRSWQAIPGNLHLSVHFAPGREVERFEVTFTVLAALSVLDALDAVPGMEGRAGLKWVNDVVVEGAKVAGVLAYTQTQDRTVGRAVLGMGVNVLATPGLEPTPFVPAVTSVGEVLGSSPHGLLGRVFRGLLDALDRNYRTLLEEGFRPLLVRYRERSVILGQEVAVCSEDSGGVPQVIAHGRVLALGDGLELHLEGRDQPVTRGRLILGRGAPDPRAGGSPPSSVSSGPTLSGEMSRD